MSGVLEILPLTLLGSIYDRIDNLPSLICKSDHPKRPVIHIKCSLKILRCLFFNDEVTSTFSNAFILMAILFYAQKHSTIFKFCMKSQHKINSCKSWHLFVYNRKLDQNNSTTTKKNPQLNIFQIMKGKSPLLIPLSSFFLMSTTLYYTHNKVL